MKNKKNGKLKFLRKKILMGLILGTAILVPMMPSAYALPNEGSYASSNASTVTTSNNIMSITGTTENNVVNWDTFSIADGETVNFTNNQNYLNLVNGVSKSTIDGVLNSGTGDIYLVNPNGIIFGSNATVNVGSLITSTRAITDVNITEFVKNGTSPITNSTVESVVGNITNLGKIQANNVVLEGNEVIIQNADNVTIYSEEVDFNRNPTKTTTLLTGDVILIKASDDITVGHEVTDNDLNETNIIPADYGHTEIGTGSEEGITYILSSEYTATDLDGTSKDITEAFLVEDVYDLQNMNANLSANYLLADNIDGDSTIFTPVGTSNDNDSFTGSFNGAGNVISGLTIGETGDSYVGLFGYAEGASIKNVGLDNAVSGEDSVGGLVGYAYNTTINNSYNTGAVSGDWSIGGLVGHASNTTINNSYNAGAVSGNWATGGLVGYIENYTMDNKKLLLVGYIENDSDSDDGDSTNSIIISDSYNTGDVSGSSNVGGLVGYIRSNSNSNSSIAISNSYNIGDVSGTSNLDNALRSSVMLYSRGEARGSSNVGGLVGYIENYSYNYNYNDSDDGDSTTNSITISNSYNTGDVSGNWATGGLVGYIENYTMDNKKLLLVGYIENDSDSDDGDSTNSITISNSYNTGDVSGDWSIGGLVGYIENYSDSDDGDSTNSIAISSSYNTGEVSGTSNTDELLTSSRMMSRGFIGGLVGFIDSPSIIELNDSYNSGDVSGSTLVGGLFGAASQAIINNSYNTGKIGSTQEYAGGLAGGVDRAIEINNSYSIGDISGSAMVGGLVGYASNTTINNSYNTGKVIGSSNVGGILGYNEEYNNISNLTSNTVATRINYLPTITNSYYATTDADGNDINQNSNSYGIGKTYEEMMQASTYAFADEIDTTGGQDTTWRMYEGYTTPMLKSFMETVEVADTVDLYNGKEQTGTVITADGKVLNSNIYGNKGTAVGEYTIYSNQQGYDLVSSNGKDATVYTIKSLQSLVADKNENYNAVVGIIGHRNLPSVFLAGAKLETTGNHQLEITNNGGATGIGTATYDQKTDSIIISG